MAEPERPWDVVGGNTRWHRPSRPSLHLLVPADAAFDLPRLFREAGGAGPVPVVVVGTFNGPISPPPRGTHFTVAALAWRLGEVSANELVIVGVRPAEDRAAVEARVEAAVGPARETWTAVVDGDDVTDIDVSPDKELAGAPSVWKVTRLTDEAGRPVIRSAYTADGSHRVWEPGRLAPERQVEITGLTSATIVAVTDQPDIVGAIREAGTAEPAPESSRLVTKGVPVPVVVSNPTGRPNELRIHWTGTDCDERWYLEIGWDRRSIGPRPVRRTECQAVGLDIDIVLTLSEPMPVDSLIVGGIGAGG